MFLKKIATVVALTTLASSAWAGCGISEGRVSIVGNEFPAIQTVGAGAMECAGGYWDGVGGGGVDGILEGEWWRNRQVNPLT